MNENDRGQLVSFVLEMKNTQLTKLNSATFSVGALILFIVSAFILIINKLPMKKIGYHDLYLFLLFCHCFFSVVSVGFNYLNRFFRQDHVIKNIRSTFNVLEKQFMKLFGIFSIIITTTWFLVLILMIVFMVIQNYRLWFIVVLNFSIFAYMSVQMFGSAVSVKQPPPCHQDEGCLTLALMD
jgi:hypothetical protein